MLTSFDDYPIHQTSAPIAHTVTGDLNHYDRYFFNGYTPDGSLFFALAMGLYPNRFIADSAFCVVRGGQHTSVYASRRAPSDRTDANVVGPIRVEVVEPLRVLRLVIDAPEQGLRGELRFERRSPPVEEPPFVLRNATRTAFDYTRLTQFGRWSGWLEVDGQRIEIGPEVVGSRDRSWGVRPVGERGPSGAPPTSLPQFFWLWAPVNFPTRCTHFDVNDFADGRRWHEFGCVAADGDAPPVAARTVDYRVEWRPGTRWATRFEYDLIGWDDAVTTVRLEPLYEFHMRGIGYGHPEWAHGTWRGELEVGGERLAHPVADPCRPDNVHIQAVCAATYIGADGETAQGIGVLEQLAIGPHPTGLTGIFDAYTPG